MTDKFAYTDFFYKNDNIDNIDIDQDIITINPDTNNSINLHKPILTLIDWRIEID